MADRFGAHAFRQLASELRKISKPNMTASNIDKAIDASRRPVGKAAPSPVKNAPSRHSVGFLGEERMRSAVQQRGELALSDKADFKALTRGGIDGISIGLKKGRMILNWDENKAYSKPDNIRSASAVGKNFTKNRARCLAQMNDRANDKSLPPALQKLNALAVELANRGMERVRIFNGGGNSKGTTIANATFVDLRPPGGLQFKRSKPAPSAGGGGNSAPVQRGGSGSGRRTGPAAKPAGSPPAPRSSPAGKSSAPPAASAGKASSGKTHAPSASAHSPVRPVAPPAPIAPPSWIKPF